MGNLLKNTAFIVGALFFLSGSGIAINFWLRSKPLQIPVLMLVVIGLVIMLVEIASARHDRSRK